MKRMAMLGLCASLTAVLAVTVGAWAAMRSTPRTVTIIPSTRSTVSAGGLPTGVTLRQIDGGPHYFAHLHAKSAWMDSTMLLGAWEEEPLNAAEVRYDERMGNRIYWSVASNPHQRACGGPCLTDYNVIRAGRMRLCTPDRPDSESGFETVCAEVGDELDMSTGPNPAAAEKAYNNPPVRGVVTYQGYGKGVLFWESDAQARQFVKYSDILAADSYWMTDSDLNLASQGGCALLPGTAACGNGGGRGLTTAERELPANYAYNVTRLEYLEALNGGSKPVVVDVETGCPGNNGACTTPAAFRAAAWQAVIAGARGIIWFQHNFGGPCIDFNTFYDGSNPTTQMYRCQITPGETLRDLASGVSAFNHQVLRLSSVLLSPFAEHYVKVGRADVSVMAKYSEGKFYIFAASGRTARVPAQNQRVTFTVARGYTGPVTVVGENRRLHAVNGIFTDTFATEDTVHIYEMG